MTMCELALSLCRCCTYLFCTSLGYKVCIYNWDTTPSELRSDGAFATGNATCQANYQHAVHSDWLTCPFWVSAISRTSAANGYWVCASLCLSAYHSGAGVGGVVGELENDDDLNDDADTPMRLEVKRICKSCVLI